MSGFVGVHSFLEGTVAASVGIIADSSFAVAKEALVDSLKRFVSLFGGLFNAVAMVFGVLVFGSMMLIFSHLW